MRRRVATRCAERQGQLPGEDNPIPPARANRAKPPGEDKRRLGPKRRAVRLVPGLPRQRTGGVSTSCERIGSNSRVVSAPRIASCPRTPEPANDPVFRRERASKWTAIRTSRRMGSRGGSRFEGPTGRRRWRRPGSPPKVTARRSCRRCCAAMRDDVVADPRVAPTPDHGPAGASGGGAGAPCPCGGRGRAGNRALGPGSQFGGGRC